MDVYGIEHLHRYSRGEMTSRSLREATGLDYGQILGALSELGLRPPLARFDGINGPALRRGYDLMLSMLTKPRRNELWADRQAGRNLVSQRGGKRAEACSSSSNNFAQATLDPRRALARLEIFETLGALEEARDAG